MLIRSNEVACGCVTAVVVFLLVVSVKGGVKDDTEEAGAEEEEKKSFKKVNPVLSLSFLQLRFC